MLDEVKMYEIKNIEEENGNIAFLELPFFAIRIFYVYGVRVGNIRGYHSHKECEQFLICQSGKVNITCDDGKNRQVYTLDSSFKGLYIPPMIWSEQFYHSNDTILVGLASHPFDEEDYIRDYSKFKEELLKS